MTSSSYGSWSSGEDSGYSSYGGGDYSDYNDDYDNYDNYDNENDYYRRSNGGPRRRHSRYCSPCCGGGGGDGGYWGGRHLGHANRQQFEGCCLCGLILFFLLLFGSITTYSLFRIQSPGTIVLHSSNDAIPSNTYHWIAAHENINNNAAPTTATIATTSTHSYSMPWNALVSYYFGSGSNPYPCQQNYHNNNANNAFKGNMKESLNSKSNPTPNLNPNPHNINSYYYNDSLSPNVWGQHFQSYIQQNVNSNNNNNNMFYLSFQQFSIPNIILTPSLVSQPSPHLSISPQLPFFTISALIQPSTGYRWNGEWDKNQLNKIDEFHFPIHSTSQYSVVGGFTEIHTWVFKVLRNVFRFSQHPRMIWLYQSPRIFNGKQQSRQLQSPQQYYDQKKNPSTKTYNLNVNANPQPSANAQHNYQNNHQNSNSQNNHHQNQNQNQNQNSFPQSQMTYWSPETTNSITHWGSLSSWWSGKKSIIIIVDPILYQY